MDQSPETPDRITATPDEPAQSASVRGWQALAEKRGQELQDVRARLAAYEADTAARQLAAEYPDAAELVLRDGGALSASMANELAATQRGIEAAREQGSFIHPNNPRKPTTKAPVTIAELEREAGDMLASHLANRF